MFPSLKMAAEVVTHAVEQPCAQHCRIGMEKDSYVPYPWQINPQLPLMCNLGEKENLQGNF